MSEKLSKKSYIETVCVAGTLIMMGTIGATALGANLTNDSFRATVAGYIAIESGMRLFIYAFLVLATSALKFIYSLLIAVKQAFANAGMTNQCRKPTTNEHTPDFFLWAKMMAHVYLIATLAYPLLVAVALSIQFNSQLAAIDISALNKQRCTFDVFWRQDPNVKSKWEGTIRLADRLISPVVMGEEFEAALQHRKSFEPPPQQESIN